MDDARGNSVNAAQRRLAWWRLRATAWAISLGEEKQRVLHEPIASGIGLGGVRLGAHIQEYEPLLASESDRRSRVAADLNAAEEEWAHASYFEVTYDIPPIAISIDVRDGVIFKLSAISPDYGGSFDGIRVGARVGDVLRRADARWDFVEDGVVFDKVEGLAMFTIESDPLEHEIADLNVSEIAVFLPERGTAPSINIWPPRQRDAIGRPLASPPTTDSGS